MYIVKIPELKEGELMKRYQKVKPIVEVEGKKHFLRDLTEKELINLPYTLEVSKILADTVNMEEYIPIVKTLKCICKCTEGERYFTPKVQEILAQIPEHTLPFVALNKVKEAEEKMRKLLVEGGYLDE